MKIGLFSRIAGMAAFIFGMVSTSTLCAEFWQAMVAASLFGLFLLFLNAD